jgi:hypothetical protein
VKHFNWKVLFSFNEILFSGISGAICDVQLGQKYLALLHEVFNLISIYGFRFDKLLPFEECSKQDTAGCTLTLSSSNLFSHPFVAGLSYQKLNFH